MSSPKSVFAGVQELLRIPDELEDGVELVWIEETCSQEKLVAIEERIDGLRLSSQTIHSLSGWYAGEIVLHERHQDGTASHDPLIWRNLYLVNQADFASAKLKIQEIGRLEQEAGEHQCAGQKAGWEFRGITKSFAIVESPGDGSILWREILENSTADVARQIPSRDELGVFRWLGHRDSR